MWFIMPSGLHRTYGAHHLHFITCSCYRRLPFLHTARSRDAFLTILEQTRERYLFVVVGYVAMPEHIHLLSTEPEVGTPSTVMQGDPLCCWCQRDRKPGPPGPSRDFSTAHLWHLTLRLAKIRVIIIEAVTVNWTKAAAPVSPLFHVF
jgi:Transposase IS200 like